MTELAAELGVEGGGVAKRNGEREHPLAHGNLRQDAIDQVGCGIRHATGTAGRADAPSLARERNDRAPLAAGSVDTTEASLRNTTVKECAEFPAYKGGESGGAGILVTAGQESLEMFRENLVEDGLSRLPTPVFARRAARRRSRFPEAMDGSNHSVGQDVRVGRGLQAWRRHCRYLDPSA